VSGSEPTQRSKVSLREITADTVREICNLAVREDQVKFVAPNAVSIAQAYFSKTVWIRAIYADDTPVGFAMLHDEPEKPEYYLWRFMIDARWQHLGFGHQALGLVVEYVKGRPGASELLTSVHQADGGPQPFYEKFGFALTGEEEDGEAMLRLPLEVAVPIACNLDALSATEQARRTELFERFRGGIQAVDDVPGGYRVTVSEGVSRNEIEELVGYERRCCSFLRLAVGGGPDGIVVSITGSDGAKEFLDSEFGLGQRPS
jgi:diamine N-acetyltransferase